jgi:hypothetical protein
MVIRARQAPKILTKGKFQQFGLNLLVDNLPTLKSVQRPVFNNIRG